MEKIHTFFLEKAVDLAVRNISKQGGPFGAIITKDNFIIAEGVNRVTKRCDPTAHAEIMAIREACRKLDTFELRDCILYTSCEPCPMCLGAIYWARIKTIYYAASRKDAAEINFDDDFIYNEVGLSPKNRSLPFIHIPLNNALLPFITWNKKTDKTLY